MLDSTHENFKDDLLKAIKEINPKYFFDSVSGEETSQIFNLMGNDT